MGTKKLGLLAVVLAAAGAVFTKRRLNTPTSGSAFPSPAPSEGPAAEPVVPAQASSDEAGATPDEALSDSTDEPATPTTPDAPLEETTDVVDPLTDPSLSDDR